MPEVAGDSKKRKRDDEDESMDDEEDEQLFVSECDDEEDKQPYTELYENFPKCAAYDHRFALIKDEIQALAQELQGVLSRSTCTTLEVAQLREEVEKVLTVSPAKCRMIGLLADAGVGKSSLVNSLTDIPGLAKAMDGGESCTYVPILYHRASVGQTKKFSATVEFFDYLTISKLLSGCLQDWKLWNFEREDEEDWTNEEAEQYQRRAATCLSTFLALFVNTEYFKDEITAEATLNTLFEGGHDIDVQVNAYVTLASGLLAQYAQPDGTYEHVFEADTCDELRVTLDPFLSEGESAGQPILWPLVKKVSVGVQGSRILDRFILADLPGISDTNQVRIQATQRQTDECDEVWIVGRIGRIITDTTVDGLLHKYGRLLDGRVPVIATKSDENVNDALALGLRKKGCLIDGYEYYRRSSKLASRDLARMKKEKLKIRKQERGPIQEDIETRMEDQARCDNERWTRVVQARNNHVDQSLTKERAHHLPDAHHLSVFSVSNTHYAANKDAAEQPRWILSPEATGIPGLRTYALKSAAPLAVEALSDHINHKFTATLKGVDL